MITFRTNYKFEQKNNRKNYFSNQFYNSRSFIVRKTIRKSYISNKKNIKVRNQDKLS